MFLRNHGYSHEERQPRAEAEAVRRGMTHRNAEEKFNIPRRTILPSFDTARRRGHFRPTEEIVEENRRVEGNSDYPTKSGLSPHC